MKPLPIGIQTFRQIIEGGYVYADKTAYVGLIAEGGKAFFLSRPRRFGKSLFVDTLKQAFEGHRELFEGLALARTDFDFKPHPVIRLDLSAFGVQTPEELRAGVTSVLADTAAAAGLALPDGPPSVQFRRLIQDLHAQQGERVVVLVDEYDKPIIEHITNPAKAEANRAELRSLYGVLKAADDHLRLVFLTGVAKFTKTSVFSQLNNLQDITLRPEYAGICGITGGDFDALFADHLADVWESGRADGTFEPDATVESVRAEVFDWYDGFSWDGASRVFNPFSLLNFFAAKAFSPFWYSSGTPKFLLDIMRQQPRAFADVQGMTITEQTIDSHDVEHAPLESLLFQTGFLTVKSVDRRARPRTFTLGFPNHEVTQAFSQDFLMTLTGANVQNWAVTILRALTQGRPEDLEAPVAGLYASIPWNLHQPNEAFYHALFLTTAQSLGLHVEAESAVAGGELDTRIDLANGQSYVIEFKYAKEPLTLDEAVAAALAQIDRHGYAARYQGTGRQVHQVGIAVTGRGQVKVAAATA
jgi:hypothetical protein